MTKSSPPFHTDAFLRRVSFSCRRGLAAGLSLFFPWECPGCGRLLPFPSAICDECAPALPRINRPFCRRCGDPFPANWKVRICPDCSAHRRPFRALRSAFSYEGLVRKMIRDAKYGGHARYLRFFGEELYVLARREFSRPVEAIVPVPLHRAREWDRRFNQAELLARRIGTLWGLPVWKPLRKRKRTAAQSSLSGLARRSNLTRAFEFDDDAARHSIPRSVLLVDDVITTGTTISECARVLRRAGVSRVYGISIARALLR